MSIPGDAALTFPACPSISTDRRWWRSRPGKHRRLLSAALLLLLAFPARGQEAVEDDFSAYASGSDAASAWQAAGGFWYVADAAACSETEAFDTGLFRPVFMDRAYAVSVRFRVTSAYRGAGVLFNSASATSAAYSHMIRLDGDLVIYGAFDAGSFEGTGSVNLPASFRDDVWHTLHVAVDPIRGTYTFSLDGTVLRADAPLRYRTGFAGLQNSGGAACFDDFALRPVPEAPTVSPIPWPVAVAPDGTGSGVWVGTPATGAVQRLSLNGAVLATLNAGRATGSAFVAPAALGAFRDGGVAVLDTTARRVHRFDGQGRWMATWGQTFQRPYDLAAWPDGTVAVSDPAAGTIHFFDAALHPLGTLDAPMPVAPTLLAAADSMLAFLDRDGRRIHLLRGAGAAWEPVATFDAPLGALRGLAMNDRALFATVRDRVLRFDAQGQTTGSLSLEEIDNARPQRLAVEGRRLYLPDFTGDRILLADTALTAPNLRFAFNRNPQLQVAWESPEAAISRIALHTDDGPFARSTVRMPLRRHFFELDGIEPSTLYRIRYAPQFAAIPPDTSLSQAVVAMSPPPRGTTQYVELKGVVLLFANVTDTTQAAAPPLPPLPEDEIDRILAQVEDGRRFFWMNAGMRFHLALDTFVVRRPMRRDSLFGLEWYYPPREGLAERTLQTFGADIDDYRATFVLAAVRDYDAETGTWDLRGRGGAFTNGLGWNNRFGQSWWEVTRRNHRSGNNWLVVHEFHHQLDELFQLSGYPGYWFNHFAPHIGTAADFGEHFDGNAYLLRTWPPDRWFALRHTHLRYADDADDDGLPDDAPALPMDEARLGSSPAASDTDHDGLTDRAELALANWVVEGGGETYGRPARFPGLGTPDTDGDGLRDGADPYPLYPFAPEIPRLETEPSFALLGRTDDPRAPYTLHAAWSPDSLFLRFTASADRRVRLLLDADADGWFVGRDNLFFTLGTSDTLGATLEVFDAALPDQWPRMDPALAATVRYTWRRLPGGTGFQLSLARNERLGLRLHEGATMGLDVGVSITAPQGGLERDVSLYEPNRFFDVTLR